MALGSYGKLMLCIVLFTASSARGDTATLTRDRVIELVEPCVGLLQQAVVAALLVELLPRLVSRRQASVAKVDKCLQLVVYFSILA